MQQASVRRRQPALISSSVRALEGWLLLAIFYFLPTFRETSVPLINAGMTDYMTVTCILNYLQCFWSTSFGLYAKLNCCSLCIHNYGYNAQKINLQNMSQLISC